MISDGGVDYICCGAGSEVRPVKAVKGTKFCLSRSGFATLTLDETALALGFRDYTGATVYTATIPHEMILLDLYESLHSLDTLTGTTTTDDILNLIFSKFCIGK